MQSSSKSLLFSTVVLTLASISSAQTPQSTGLTIKSTAQIVIVDVIVSGKDGRPVHDLKASDFALTENGKDETISHFEEHMAPSPQELAAPITPLKLPSGVFTNYLPRPSAGPLNILLLDKLNTPLNDQEFVHKQLIQFLKKTAMLYGAPAPTQIIFKVAVDRNPNEQQTLAPGNTSPTKAKGPFQLFNVQYAVSRNSIDFIDGTDGTHQGAIGFDVFVYNHDGVIVNAVTSVIRANLSPEAFDKLLTLGVQYKQSISVPVKGTYYLRVGIHDLRSNRVGAVEIPIVAIGNQPPLAATASNPAKSGEAAK